MKRNIFISLLFFGSVLLCTQLQSCRDDEMFQNVAVTSQEALDDLRDTSPRYVGNLILVGEDIESLESLSHIEKIIGNLVIADTNLESLDGLENLILVTGDISIRSTPPYEQPITDFCALQQLLVGGSFKSIAILNNLHNPTVQDIIDGNCSF